MILDQGRNQFQKSIFQTPQKKVATLENQTLCKEVEKKQDKLGNKGKNVEVKDAKTNSISFNLEQEVVKIEIPIPLTKLVKNQPLKEYFKTFISFHKLTS